MNKKAEVKWGEIIFSFFVVFIIAFSFEEVKKWLSELIGTALTIFFILIILSLIAMGIYWFFNRRYDNI